MKLRFLLAIATILAAVFGTSAGAGAHVEARRGMGAVG
ncbi:SH3 domain-containing protein, partial [Mesorhizobium sp. M8A.F.Ca.ET.059.01.1.1]